MADREPDLIVRLGGSVASVDAAAWNALAGTDQPFLRHAFLALLESSVSVGDASGWTPAPILVERRGKLVAAAPAYLKAHSQGEYVFDHGWADAWMRAGGDYYPKLQVAVPFTPVPGPRLLGSEPDALLGAIEAVTDQNRLSSAHITFACGADLAPAEARGWLRREGIQYHWLNHGYENFDDFLAALASRKRKAIRRERAAANAGIEVVARRGPDIGATEWDAMWRCYQDTGQRKWGRPYLTREWFEGLAAAMGDAVLLFLAYADGRPIAGALNFVDGEAIYGRYWGSIADRPFLHFELSYYRAIEWAIDQRLQRVEAGAQGEHKLARGYRPVTTNSLHYIPNPGFRRAVAEFVERERDALVAERAWAAEGLPYRSA